MEECERYKHTCVHPDCMYSGSRQHRPWGCEYASVTRHSRVAWHRERGLPEEPQYCLLYEKGARPKRFKTSVRRPPKKSLAYTNGRVRVRKPDTEPTVYRKLTKQKKHVDHDKRLALYCEGLNDRQIAEELQTSIAAITQWRQKNKLPSRMRLEQERKAAEEIAERERKEALAAEEHRRRMELYSKGLSNPEIAAAVGVHRHVIEKWRKDNNLKDYREIKREKEMELFVTLHEAGWCFADCVKILHIGLQKQRQFQAELGLEYNSTRPTAEVIRHREEVLAQLRESGQIK